MQDNKNTNSIFKTKAAEQIKNGILICKTYALALIFVTKEYKFRRMQNADLNKAGLTTIGNTETGHFYWVGKGNNNIEHFAGQTFTTNRNGALKSIRIFPEMIVGETDALLSVHNFDAASHTWKEQKAESRKMLNKQMEKQWVQFDMHVELDANQQYAFKISCNHGGMMAIAECKWDAQQPNLMGEQWVASSTEPEGHFHKHFGFAFVAEIQNH